MIVMKFGGASLASPTSIKRVASIVLSQVERHPIVVVSALGETTDHLLQILEHASRAESYLALKLQEEVKTSHFCIAEDLLSPSRLEPVDLYIRQTFRDLHVRMLEVCDGERSITPELRDWVVSLGEQLSSRIVAAALEENGMRTVHIDSTKLILTDDHFTNAVPQYWETYARIRWSVPIAARDRVVVLGGFIGATEDGRTTTLGRGGSDLTASIVGAAVNAEEIQVWKDVDGMLTWDPRVRAGGYRVKSLSYQEASELAQAGATILHPETIAPAERLGIPVVIRNTFRPECPGTRISRSRDNCFNPVKSIACKTNVTVVELRSSAAGPEMIQHLPAISELTRRHKGVTLLAISEKVMHLAVDANGRDPGMNFAPDHCMEVHIRTNQAVLTLVGHGLKGWRLDGRLSALLSRFSALMLPEDNASCSLRIVVAQEDLSACADLLERTLFTDLDPNFFGAPDYAPEEQEVRRAGKSPVSQTEWVSASTRHRFLVHGVQR
jgi:aspartate kinase